MASNLYEQVSLVGKPNTIRVLQLSTDQTKPLEGHFEVISLSPPRLSFSSIKNINFTFLKQISLTSIYSYCALSYTWGAYSDPPDRILCYASSSPGAASAYIRITRNCRNALHQLRKNLAPHGRPLSFNIWVDAICIDQTPDGEAEKVHQIPLMQDIYGKAKMVYIWLGPASDNSDNAMDWIKQASLGKFPLSGVRFKNYPANMLYPSELVKLARIVPEVLEGCESKLLSLAASFNNFRTSRV